MIPFVHLHVHSQYSILDGQAPVKGIVDKAIANGMKGVALTDHGNMFGIKELHDYVNKKNSDVNSAIKDLKKKLEEEQAKEYPNEDVVANLKIDLNEQESKLFKPIFGCEAYVANDDMHSHTDNRDYGRHLILLAKNLKGYHNLIKIVSKAWTEGFYMHARTDKSELAKYHEGVICCSACLGGEVPQLIMNGDIEGARKAIEWYKGVFGDDYYLELQRHKATVPNANHETFQRQQEVNAVLIQLSKELGVKLICTNDSHFVNEDDADAHERLVLLSTGKRMGEANTLLYSKQEWFKTQEEMNTLFADVPEALQNTTEILDKVEIYSINHAPILPDFPLPDGFDNEDDYLRYLVYEGAKERWPDMDEEHRERIDFELETIKKMGFPGYFLIVQDYIRVAPSLGCAVGPGRGSAAGSAVAYCLGITKIDPIKYDLLFERFLNPDRISLPDIDVDFDDDGRAAVLKYVTEKYGAEKVAHIITYGTMAAKMAIKDVARVHDLPIPESDRLAKFIPSKPGDMPEDEKGKNYKISIKNCLKCFPDFRHELDNPNPVIGDTIRFAEKLEGNVRNTGVHACGVIIGRDDITDWVPVSTAPDKDGSRIVVTQYEGSVIEETGLIKMDFLGLKTLSIIKDTLENIKSTRGIDIDIEKIPIDDPKTYQLYEDLIAMNALYRPGPMAYIPQFIARKHGRDPITYDFPEMEKYLKDTYGITVYQEQVMLLSRLLAGFTRGESDVLRKAMGKKQKDKLDKLKPKFLQGGEDRGHDRKTLEKIWSDWEAFASYAFNKSHATCYSWVAYQTAYLKANYPSEYMAAVLSRSGDVEKMTKFMDECKSMGITVKGPDINESYKSFSANKDGDIRFGLNGIKGFGGNSVDAIITEREKNGPFKDIFDVVERVNLTTCNRRAIEALALSGAFDSFGLQRESFFEKNSKGEDFSEVLLHYGQQYQLDKSRQANTLFGDMMDELTSKPMVPKAEPWPTIERLSRERDLVGIYLSAHPLDPFYMELKFGCNATLKEFAEQAGSRLDYEYVLGGVVTDYTERPSKRGNNFGILKIEDKTGSAEFMLFDKVFASYRNYCIPGTAIAVRCAYVKNRYNDRINQQVRSIAFLKDLKGKMVKLIRINLNEKQFEIADIIKAQLKAKSEIRCELQFRVHDLSTNRYVDMTSAHKLPLTIDFLEQLDDLGVKYSVENE